MEATVDGHDAVPAAGAGGRPAPSNAPLRLACWWLAGVAAAVAHNGFWATPNLAFMTLVADRPGQNPFTGDINADYLLTNLSLPTAARLLGQTDPHAYARMHLVVLVLGWAAVTALAWRRFGYRPARNLTVLVAAAPAVTVSMQWLGQPDPLTFVLGLAMVLVRPRWALLAVGVLAGLTHPEQAVIMALVAAAVRAVLADGVGSADGALVPTRVGARWSGTPPPTRCGPWGVWCWDGP